MRRTLEAADAKAAVYDRLRELRPDTARRWGTMAPGEMLCHLADSFALGLGEREAASAESLLTRTLFRWVALELPLPWPKGVPTRATMDPKRAGTRPTELAADRERLERLIERFAVEAPVAGVRHPLFGPLSRRQWLRWGWRHADHHLRQFGL